MTHNTTPPPVRQCFVVMNATKNLCGNVNHCTLERNVIGSLRVSMQGHRRTKLLPNCCRRRTNGRNGDTRTGEGETFLIREYLHSSVHTVKEKHGTSSVYVSLDADCQSNIFFCVISTYSLAHATLKRNGVSTVSASPDAECGINCRSNFVESSVFALLGTHCEEESCCIDGM